MKARWTLPLLSIAIVLIALPSSPARQADGPASSRHATPELPASCTSFCLDVGDRCVFGTNNDNTLQSGYLYVNKRGVMKTTWDPSTSGEYGRWTSKYGSVTINFVSYQMAWGGMNETGLVISTMSLNQSRGPVPDERLPFQSPFWMQYQLDMHSTVEQVIASDSDVRLPESQVDHYLVCDRTGACAVIEFLEGRLVVHAGDSLPVKALTNSTYATSLQEMDRIHQEGGEITDDSMRRFVGAADRLAQYASSGAGDALEYAFDTLEAVSRPDTAWSFVYDPAELRVHFRSARNPNIRSLALADLDLSCRTPARMLDVHAPGSGDIGDQLVAYSHAAGFAHAVIFFTQYEGFSMSPFLVDTLLTGLESFPCQEDRTPAAMDLQRYSLIMPPTVVWAGRTLLHRLLPGWAALVGVSLVCLLWLMRTDKPTATGRPLRWILMTLILGPVGLLAYVITHRKRRQGLQAA